MAKRNFKAQVPVGEELQPQPAEQQQPAPQVKSAGKLGLPMIALGVIVVIILGVGASFVLYPQGSNPILNFVTNLSNQFGHGTATITGNNINQTTSTKTTSYTTAYTTTITSNSGGTTTVSGGTTTSTGTTTAATTTGTTTIPQGSAYVYCPTGNKGAAFSNGTLYSNYSYYAAVNSSGIEKWINTTGYAPYNKYGGANDAACVTNNGYVYCTGGEDIPAVNNTWFAPLSSSGIGSWTKTTPPPTSLFNSCAAYNNYDYCVQPGSPSYFAPISSSGTGNWTQTTSLPRGTSLANCGISKGYMYCVGISGAAYYAPVWQTGIGNWTLTSNIPHSSVSQIYCPIYAGYIYCLVGNTSASYTYYAPVSSNGIGAWTITSSLPNPPYGSYCIANNNTIYCTAVYNPTPPNIPYLSYYSKLSNPGVGTWISTASLPVKFSYTNSGCFIPTTNSGPWPPQPLTVGPAKANPTNPNPGTTVSIWDTLAAGGYGLISYQWLMKTPSNSSYIKLTGATTNATSFYFGGVASGNYAFELNVKDGTGNTTNSLPAFVNYGSSVSPTTTFNVMIAQALSNVASNTRVFRVDIYPPYGQGATLVTWGQLPFAFSTTLGQGAKYSNFSYTFNSTIINATGHVYSFLNFYPPTCKNVTITPSVPTNQIGNVVVTGYDPQCIFDANYH